MQAKGFHSTLSTEIPLHARHEYAACNLFVLHELPPDIIVDSFELDDHRLHFQFAGNTDLELPTSGVANESGWLLVAVKPETDLVMVDVPLHVRYGMPREGNLRHIIQLPPPTCFWACPSSYKSLHSALPPQSPKFHMLNSSTQFKILQHTTSSHISFDVPVGNINHILYIELCTATVTLLAFVYIAKHCSRTLSKILHSAHLKMQ
ncbi:PIG-X [Suillus clintonianus]|uniref:PIG-X n=1 Tax=Suillus clintonianus TaxID=1904413 RepID=UPI001B86884E|nr:PIG-X [Suillus clintonianus]KAG2149250.1 PIG-X [Suillus clintonianus]